MSALEKIKLILPATGQLAHLPFVDPIVVCFTDIPSRFGQRHSFVDTCHVTRSGIHTWPVGIGGEDTTDCLAVAWDRGCLLG